MIPAGTICVCGIFDIMDNYHIICYDICALRAEFFYL